MQRRERIGDVEVTFEDRGHGPVLVLLHPFPFDHRIWAGNIAALVAAQRRVIALDYPGFGDSPPPAEPLSISRLADLVAGLLDHLSIKTAALVGVSMGGYVALAFAGRFRDRLEALVLADTRAAADNPAALEGRASALAVIAEQGVDAYLRQSLPRLLAEDCAPELLTLALSLAERRPLALTAGIAALRDRPDRTSELAGVRCPTLVLCGQGDQICPPAEMRAIAAAIGRARFVEIAGAGHLTNLETPAAFNQALVDFLRDRPAAAPAGKITSDEAR